MLRFDLLQTPAADGQTLIEPAVRVWPELIAQTIRQRDKDQSSIRLLGTPVQVVRKELRRRLFGRDVVEPVIACGHQPEFAHPGVWAKHVVVRHAADVLGLPSLDLVVDNDAPHSTGLAVPIVDEQGLVSRKSIPVLSGVAGAAYEGRSPLCPSAVDNLVRQVAGDEDPGGESMIAEYARGLVMAERPRDFVEQHLAARAYLDRQFHADLMEVRISDAFDGALAGDILLNCERFVQAYNAALAEYREDQHVRSPDRPLPDLHRTADRVEAPFWIYPPLQQRKRLWIAAEGDRLEFFAENQSVGTLSRLDVLRNAAAALASLAPWCVRPRALTLTLWARLLVCDLFVHGIGGAKYDRITDGIFRRYYGCEPPAYACVTATLRLPLPHKPAESGDVLAARRRMRDLRFNPQRYVEHLPADLLDERKRLIERSEQLHGQRGDGLARREVFRKIRELNQRLAGQAGELDRHFELQRGEAERAVASNRVADSREFFYALQPRERLARLAANLVEAAQAAPARA